MSRVSTLAISSFRERRRETALRRIRERTMGGVWDHEGKAFCAEEMAESMSAGEAAWTFARGWAVEGSMESKVLPEVAVWTLPS